MHRPESTTGRSAVPQQLRDAVPAAIEHTDGPKRECELCETRRRLREEYGLHVCAACDEKYLP